MQYGVLCLLPPAAMLIFALKTKKSFEALIFGTLIAYLIMYKAAFIGPWCDLLLSEISNADNQYILLLCGLFGGFIFLLREAKGTLGFSNLLSRFCKNERITMMMSVFLGIIIFVDDYLNIMTVGTCMKDVCDKRKVPRQALAYIIDSTGAPVCALIPFSTWVVFYSGVFIQEPDILNMGFSTGMSVYLKVLPYMFYPMAALGMGEAHIVLEDGTRRNAACIGGMLSMMNGVCRVLATTWEWEEDIDAKRAEAAKHRAEQALANGGLTDKEYRIAEAKLQRALVRLSVKE